MFAPGQGDHIGRFFADWATFKVSKVVFRMFWAFKLSFVVDILAFFDLATFWAIFEKFGYFFLIFWLPYSWEAFPLSTVGKESRSLPK